MDKMLLLIIASSQNNHIIQCYSVLSLLENFCEILEKFCTDAHSLTLSVDLSFHTNTLVKHH